MANPIALYMTSKLAESPDLVNLQIFICHPLNKRIILTYMAYYEFTILVAEESQDAVISMLNDLGCLGVTQSDNGLLAYFTDNESVEKITDRLLSIKSILKNSGLPDDFSFSVIHMPDQDWNETWKKGIQPIDAGENLIIVPPWETAHTDRTTLVIDPGMAFGTGHHETTRFCLAQIERLTPLTKKERFLDVGTGTGILAIAACTLGFKSAVAVDTDPLAVDAAARNAALNGLEGIEVMEGGIEKTSGKFDMIAANLLSEILIAIANDLAERLAPQGIALLSGIMTGQEYDVITAYKTLGLTLVEILPDGKWVSLIFSVARI
jgi:ribosomal protein L11 methyltransferase